jgi:hypothetical protein
MLFVNNLDIDAAAHIQEAAVAAIFRAGASRRAVAAGICEVIDDRKRATKLCSRH